MGFSCLRPLLFHVLWFHGRVLLIHSPVIMEKNETFTEGDFDPRKYSNQHGLFTEGAVRTSISIVYRLPVLSRFLRFPRFSSSFCFAVFLCM